TRDGYTFEGWDPASGWENVTDNITFTAQWVRTFTVEFDLNGGNVGGIQSIITNIVNEGDSTTPPIPTYEGYDFEGWELDGILIDDSIFNNITDDMRFVAKWALKLSADQIAINEALKRVQESYIIDANDLSSFDASEVAAKLIAAIESDINNPDTIDTDITVSVAWQDDSDPNTYSTWHVTLSLREATTAPKLVSVERHLAGTPQEHNVFFNFNGGTLDDKSHLSETVPHGETTTAPAGVTRHGYKLTGWTTDNDAGITINAGGETSPITANVAFVAQWELDDDFFEVTFNLAGGEIDNDTTPIVIIVERGKDAIPPADPTKEGYTFDGWDGDYTNIQGNTSITAKWEAIILESWNVTFYPGEGNFSSDSLALASQTITNGNQAMVPTVVPPAGYADGYTLTWASDTPGISNVLGTASWTGPITADVTFTATWAKDTGTDTLPEFALNDALFDIGEAKTEGLFDVPWDEHGDNPTFNAEAWLRGKLQDLLSHQQYSYIEVRTITIGSYDSSSIAMSVDIHCNYLNKTATELITIVLLPFDISGSGFGGFSFGGFSASSTPIESTIPNTSTSDEGVTKGDEGEDDEIIEGSENGEEGEEGNNEGSNESTDGSTDDETGNDGSGGGETSNDDFTSNETGSDEITESDRSENEDGNVNNETTNGEGAGSTIVENEIIENEPTNDTLTTEPSSEPESSNEGQGDDA
ncbi:InlB B-repeat-containing protein, partial [Candidatus Saccharibacteria bacterium]|nr:InlB B-repeat-containing protein [Candidatus Saccharibacteria bacterium]